MLPRFLKTFCAAIRLLLLLGLTAGLVAGCKTGVLPNPAAYTTSQFSRFVRVDYFDNFAHPAGHRGETIFLSPAIAAGIPWNELIVSWNAEAPAGTYVKVEASAIADGKPAKFYTMGLWSLDNRIFPRTSVRGQKDADGKVDTDTLVLAKLATAAQIRITLGGTNGLMPSLKFLGLSFADTKVVLSNRPPNRAAWGKIIPTPGHSQHGYPHESGWCSPTSLSMVLSRWAGILHRPEMDLTVPVVAGAVYDNSFAGTGNWPFNTAFAGSFPGMRAYTTRFDDLREVEDWIAAGIPVILSARWDYLKAGRPYDPNGHLIVCTGFTPDGDVVINDPATRLDRGEKVQHIYKRANVIRSWGKSHNAVYLVFPEGSPLPADPYRHW